MRRPLILALALSSSWVPARAQVPEGDLAQLLPTSTIACLQVDQLEKIALLDPDGPMRQLAGHEAVKLAFQGAYDFFGGLDDEELLLALDLEPKELGRLFTGRILFAIPELILEESQDPGSNVSVQGAGNSGSASVRLSLEPSRGMLALADFGGTSARLEELLENLAVLREEEPDIHRAAIVAEDFDGVRLFNLVEIDLDQEVDDRHWLALVDELLIYSDEEDTLLDFIDLADQGAPDGDRMVDDPRYQETLDRAGPHDALLYLNLGEVLPLVNELIESELEKQGMAVAMFLRPADLVAALRLDALESAFAALRIEDDEAGLVFGVTHADTDYGLHTLMTYGDSGVEIPAFFSSDFHSASITTYDLGAAYDSFDAMLLKASPTAHGMLEGQIAQLETEAFPLRDALLTNLDSRMIEVLGYPEATLAGPEDHPTQAYVIKVKDPRTLAEALERLAAENGTEPSVEFMNETIHMLPLPVLMARGQGGAQLAFAVVGNDLVVSLGERRMVENIIAHLKNPGASLLDDDDLMDAFAALPDEDLVGLGFISVADVLANMIRGGQGALDAQLSFIDEGQEDDLEALLDAQQKLDELPDVSDIHYYVVSKTYKSGDAFIQRMLLRPDLDPEQ